MTDKEQLNTIKKTRYTFLETSKTDLQGDFEWLIEQAERVEVLEKRISDDEHFVYEIMDQNHRYREALEFYAKQDNYEEVDQYMSNINVDSGIRSQKALEEFK